MLNGVVKIKISILALLLASLCLGQAYAQTFGNWDLWDGISCGDPVAIWGGGQVVGVGSRLNLFVRGCDGGLYTRFSPDGSAANLGPWIPLGGLFNDNPSVATIPSPAITGLQDIYVFMGGTGAARNYFFTRFNQFTGWSGIQPLGGLGASEPYVCNYSTPGNPNQLAIVVRGTNNAFFIRRLLNPPADFGPWQALGGLGAGTPSCVSTGVNNILVFVRGTNGALFQRTSTNGGTTFAGYVARGGLFASNPAVASFRSGQWDLYVRGTNGGLFYKTSATPPGPTVWTNLGGLFASEISLTSLGFGRLGIAVRGTNNQVFYRHNNGSSHSNFQNVTGPLSGVIAANSKPAGAGLGFYKYTVFGRSDEDGQTYARGYENAISFGIASVTPGIFPIASVIGDFNNDNRPDIAVTNFGSNVVQVFLQNPDGTFAAPLSTAVGNGPVQLVAADFNGDGRLDLAVANQNSNNVSILLGTGLGTFTQPVGSPFAVDSAPFGIAAGSTRTGSTVTDLVTANQGTNDVSVLLGNGDGTFATAVNYLITPGATAIGAAFADFNNDGILDIVSANFATNDVTVLLGVGDGTFTTPGAQFPTGGTSPIGIVTGDFNGDGNQDVAVSHFASDGVGVLLGAGTGAFGPATIYPVGGPARVLTVCDHNGDGRLDLAVPIFGTNNLALLTGRFDGTFITPPQNLAVGSQPWGVTTGDINSDGRPDYVVANSGQTVPPASVTILLNTTPLP